MKNEAQIREALIENTIYLIGQGGFEMATTRNIAQCKAHNLSVSLNDAHIYRVFGSKEALYAEAFARLNDELFSYMCRGLDRVDFANHSVREELYLLWDHLWKFVLNGEVHSRAYTRYYYSIYMKEESLRRYRLCFETVVKRMTPIFKDEADVNALLNNVMMSMFNFAVRVFNGDILNSQSNSEHIFNVLYSTLSMYLKET